MANPTHVKQLGNLRQRPATANSADSALTDSLLERPYQSLRTPMAVTTREWMRAGKYVKLWVNPSQMNWSMAKRETVIKTAAGAVRNTWLNRFRGTYYDEPTLSITFQTGNLLPYANLKPSLFGQREISQNQIQESAEGPRDTRYRNAYFPEATEELAQLLQAPPVPPGLQNFYDFIELIDQPILSRGKEMENRHILFYRTQVFPSMRVEGYFMPDGLQFSESVDNANRLTWTAQFQVYATNPKLWKAGGLRQTYSTTLREGGFATGLLPNGVDLTSAQLQSVGVLPKNPKDPKDSKLAPAQVTPKKALVNKAGKTAIDLQKLINTTNKQTMANFSKTLDSFVKKYQLKEPEKSKFFAEMAKIENQALADGSYVPPSKVAAYAATIIATRIT